MLDPTYDYLAAWFGTAWAGAIDVPVNTALKGELLQHVLVSSGAIGDGDRRPLRPRG